MEMENGNGLLHARFAPEIRDEFVSWIEANCEKYVVAEETAERVHYHACFKSPVGSDSIKKRLCTISKEKGLVVARGKANSYYGGVKPCTDESYVCKEGKIVAVKGYSPERLTELINEGKKFIVPLVSGAAAPVTERVVVVKKARLTLAERFINYCETELRWKRDGQFGLDNYHKTVELVTREMTSYLRAKFNDPQGIIIARNALYEFADENLKEVLENRFTDKIKSFL